MTFPIAIVILGGFALVGFLVWLEYNKKREKSKPFTNPFLLTIIAGTSICVFVIAMESLEILPSNWSKEHPWVFIIIFAAVYLASATYIKKLKPKSIDQLKLVVEERLMKDGQAKIYDGDAARDSWKWYEIKETNDDSKIFNKVVNFLVLGTGVGNKTKSYLVSLDLIDGRPTRFVADPKKELLEKVFGKEETANLDLDKMIQEQGFIGEEPAGTTTATDIQARQK